MTLEKNRELGFAGLLALLSLAGAMVLYFLITSTSGAFAQSSVRPPANATVPTDGKVPGEAMGNISDAEMWRNVRKGIVGTVSIPDKNAAQLVQSEGDNWRAIKNGPLSTYGVWAMAGMTVFLILFFLVRGRIRIDAGKSGQTITRFAGFERTGHWLLAVSFIILAFTGLNITYGKYFILPVLGKSAFASIALMGKWLHNYVAFAFMVGLAMVLVVWIKDNFPNRHDIVWLLKGGGMFSKGSHPPAKKFNAGQKIIFWLVILGGISISLSGIALLFPFQTALFAKTFAIMNVFGFNFPTELSPIQEMQYATLWHAIVAIFLVCVILAHIYIGTIGMEGAFDAMGSGEVDENWAKEHHSVWYEEEMANKSEPPQSSPSTPSPAPAE